MHVGKFDYNVKLKLPHGYKIKFDLETGFSDKKKMIIHKY